MLATRAGDGWIEVRAVGCGDFRCGGDSLPRPSTGLDASDCELTPESYALGEVWLWHDAAKVIIGANWGGGRVLDVIFALVALASALFDAPLAPLAPLFRSRCERGAWCRRLVAVASDPRADRSPSVWPAYELRLSPCLLLTMTPRLSCSWLVLRIL